MIAGKYSFLLRRAFLEACCCHPPPQHGIWLHCSGHIRLHLILCPEDGIYSFQASPWHGCSERQRLSGNIAQKIHRSASCTPLPLAGTRLAQRQASCCMQANRSVSPTQGKFWRPVNLWCNFFGALDFLRHVIFIQLLMKSLR